MTALRSHTVQLPLGTDLDPLTLAGYDGCYFSRNGMTVATKGIAATIELNSGIGDTYDLQRQLEFFRSIVDDRPEDQPGTGALLVGSIPFDPRQPARLIVPELSYVRSRDGSEWLTHTGSISHPKTTASELTSLLMQSACQGSCAINSPSPSTGEFGSEESFGHLSSTSSADYEKMVATALEAIEDNLVEKVVLAREVRFTTKMSYDPVSLLRHAQSRQEPLSYFHIGPLVGASPELLISKMNRVVNSCPLAGTRELSYSGGPPSDAHGMPSETGHARFSELLANDRSLLRKQQELESSVKDLAEHRFVVEAVSNAISPLCVSIEVPSRPQALTLQTLMHLSTPIKGVLADRHGQIPVLELVSRLHPTPAVGGVPKDKAISLINELEPFERGSYGGAVGWMDKAGNGEWAIAMRCAEIDGSVVRMLAGAGVVRESLPSQEAAEVGAKIRSTIQLFWPRADSSEIDKALDLNL